MEKKTFFIRKGDHPNLFNQFDLKSIQQQLVQKMQYSTRKPQFQVINRFYSTKCIDLWSVWHENTLFTIRKNDKEEEEDRRQKQTKAPNIHLSQIEIDRWSIDERITFNDFEHYFSMFFLYISFHEFGVNACLFT